MRKTDSSGLGYPGREKPPGLRDAEPHGYVFEEVTPERMRRVDLLAEGGSDSAGTALPNNRRRVYRYLCPRCSKVTTALARHAGHVPYIVDCADPGCAGEAVQEEGAPARGGASRRDPRDLLPPHRARGGRGLGGAGGGGGADAG